MLRLKLKLLRKRWQYFRPTQTYSAKQGKCLKFDLDRITEFFTRNDDTPPKWVNLCLQHYKGNAIYQQLLKKKLQSINKHDSIPHNTMTSNDNSNSRNDQYADIFQKLTI